MSREDGFCLKQLMGFCLPLDGKELFHAALRPWAEGWRRKLEEMADEWKKKKTKQEIFCVCGWRRWGGGGERKGRKRRKQQGQEVATGRGRGIHFHVPPSKETASPVWFVRCCREEQNAWPTLNFAPKQEGEMLGEGEMEEGGKVSVIHAPSSQPSLPFSIAEK